MANEDTLIQINVTNNSPYLQNFYFFQQPANYIGGEQVYSNSLLSTPLMPHSQGGTVYSFSLKLQYYAGVQEQHNPPIVGEPSGYTSAIQAIGLTPQPGGTPTNNSTQMMVSPGLGLQAPTIMTDVQPGAFRIVSPSFNSALKQYNGGSAVVVNGGVVLSNFVAVMPNSHLDCQPVLKFYVHRGTYTAGTVMDFTSSSIDAALCDATTGYTTFNVTYNADGTWKVDNSVTRTMLTADDHGNVSVNSSTPNVDIKNEAGTQVICRGNANSFGAAPVVITNLTNPDVIHVYAEYQIGPLGGPYTGRMCIAKNGNMATFK
ncbi:hypothetical protein [Azotobacter salinestris]|uniref:hypothetical protein n=1 Tax=Azotobacter salinestris TaxID=69964 RepID=UPI001266B959|nr:hypothetical protein [Azotobacter salinestris]